MSLRRLLAVARKELIQLRRDPRSLILAFFLPPFLILFFGYAIQFDVDDIRLVVVDQDRTQESRRLVEAFTSSRYFTVTERPASAREAGERLARGKALAALLIPPGFARDLEAGRGAPLQLLLDGSDANTATIALTYARAIVADRAVRTRVAARRVAPPVRAESRVWYNETLESRNMVVPGLIAVIISIVAALLTALTLAREWERGTMEQLVATPVGRAEVLLGKMLPYFGICLFNVGLTVAAGLLLFHVPFRGSVLLLLLTTGVFLAGALGFGILISAVARTQVLATQMAMLATYMPALVLSGFIFSIANMPPVLQAVTYLFAARYYVTITKGIFLKGAGLDVLWAPALSLTLYALVGITLAWRAFRKEIPA
jgi:ABC-2 type transport system permease protein